MALDAINIQDCDMAASSIKTISDETCEGSELQSALRELSELTEELDALWVSNAATKSKEEMRKSIENLKNLTMVLNHDGAVAAADLNDIIESQN